MPLSPIRVVTSEQSSARDAAAIAAGTPSRALMQRAGSATAAEIALRYRALLRRGVLVFAGPGNNGGDAWVVARALAASGVRVRVCEAGDARTDDARAERALALPVVELVTADESQLKRGDIYRGEGVIVDGLLGTGSSGAPRERIAAAVAGLRAIRDRASDATIVALDLPTGVDATTGQPFAPAPADVTFTYGTLKRGHLLARAACGRIVVLDIGIDAQASIDDAPALVGARWVAERVPDVAPDAHKGTRRKIAIIGGGAGMSGAAVLAARAAWRSGVGMVKIVASPDSLAAIREAEPQSLTAAWPATEKDVKRDIASWADAVAIGPGIGGGAAARELVERVLRTFEGPAVLDADALNAFSGDVNALASLLVNRPTVLTPHPVEFGRLTGIAVDDVLKRRFDVALPLAKHTGAVVLLKGQPTIVTSPAGERVVSASGTPLLAAAGSGDVLTGIVATLAAQTGDPFAAAACGAWVHGHAAWLSQHGQRNVRGFTLDDMLAQLQRAWPRDPGPSRYPVLMELPSLTPPRR